MPSTLRTAAVIAAVALSLATAGVGLPQSDSATRLAERHEEFLEAVALLIADEEREAFLELGQEHQRDRFIKRFWQVRDPFPQTARNEFRDNWEENRELAKLRFDDLSDPRAQMILFFGEEKRSFRTTCSETLRPLEIWYFDSIKSVRPEFYLIFLRIGGQRVRAWSYRDGLLGLKTAHLTTTSDQELLALVAQTCSRGDDIVTAVLASADWEAILDSLPMRPRKAKEWVASFVASSTDIPEGAELLEASFSTNFPGIHGSRTVAQLIFSVAGEQAQIAQTGEHRSYNFLVDGEILLRGELFDTFRYKFDVPPSAEGDQTIALALERYLRPATYTWIVRLQDLNSERYFRLHDEIEVPNPRIDAASLPPAPEPDGFLELLTEANASLVEAVDGDHVLKLWAPSDRLVTGTVRVSAETGGEGISKVAFDLNGKQVMSKSRAPYSIELNLGKAPRVHTLQARAVDAEGRTLARDQVLINAGPHRFGVRLIEPQRGRRYTQSVRAHAEVEIPEGEELDRLEIYLNEDLVASLYQAPFIQPILIPSSQELGYVRAVAYLADGNSTEDLVLVNSPYPVDQVQIDFVELYASVFDSKGRPVEELSKEDFVVKEDGEEQAIRRFEAVNERPIHAGILLDTSTSMTDALEEAEKAALKFFESVLRPRDRASLMTFNDVPDLVVPFTNNLEILAGGLAGLVTEGETALHDSLIFALHYFSGLRGKRALILLSDGEDTGSEYSFDDVLEFARHTGVAVYSIGLEMDQREIVARSKLSRLARETGGRHFFISGAGGLGSVYRKIENELRAQYLIAYQSSQGQAIEKFRKIELEVRPPGLQAKTMRGYYP